MSNYKRLSVFIRLMFLGLLALFGIMAIIASAPAPKTSYSPDPPASEPEIYSANYQISLVKVERPEKASKRYGLQKVDAITTDAKYKYSFEDDMVRILWSVGSRQISFLLQNKTDYSVKIPWDEAAFVDEVGRSHRVMHGGVKYTDKDKSQPPTIIVRKGSIEDIVFPTDYVSFESGTRYSVGSWVEKPLFLNHDYHGGTYSSLGDFKKTVSKNVGKQIQVLLPIQIQDVINDYIFIFNVDKVSVLSSSNKAEREKLNEGVTPKDDRFITYDNGTVMDKKSSLMWAEKDNGANINWQGAKSYCENYRGGGYTDWRMPTTDELSGLYNANKSRPAACNRSSNIHVETELIDITCFAPWASETRGTEAAYFVFYFGTRGWYPQSNDYGLRALPVRSGK